MSQVITIRIEVPDGTLVRVDHRANDVPESFLTEPLPVETFAAEESFEPRTTNGHAVAVAVAPAPVAPAPAPAVVRTIAVQQPAGRPWQAGDVHATGHKPLRTNQRGLYCPSKINGVFCDWRL